MATRSLGDELERLFEHSHDAVCLAGLDGSFRRVNRGFARLLGYSREELLARPFLDHVHPDDLEATRAVLGDLAGGKDLVSFESRLVTADGWVRSIEWQATPFEEGVVFGIGRDVTARNLATEQISALRRVATMVAAATQPHDLFALVAAEVARVIDVPAVNIASYDSDDSVVYLASFSDQRAAFDVGTRRPLDGTSVVAEISRSHRPARIDDYSELEGVIAEHMRGAGFRSTVGSPIVVAGRLWGAVLASSPGPEPLPPDTEARLADFTELLEVAIANAESREALERLAKEQAALRRVATLAAQGVHPTEIFSAVSHEVGQLFGTNWAFVGRFDPDGPTIVAMGAARWDAKTKVGTRWALDDSLTTTEVYRTGRSARSDNEEWSHVTTEPVGKIVRRTGTSCAVSSPITVEGRLWGAVSVASPESLPADTADRLEKFTAIVSTAIANAEGREARERLAEEQSALRRIATLVAQGVPAAVVFTAVSKEVAQLFGEKLAVVGRYDAVAGADVDSVTIVGIAGDWIGFDVGTSVKLTDDTPAGIVFATGRPARVDGPDWWATSFEMGKIAEELGVVSSVSCPIVVDGSLWGVMSALGNTKLLPADTAQRLERFSELIATAIANAESRETLERLAEEQSALRRAATMVSEGVAPEVIFSTVSNEVGRLFASDTSVVLKFEHDWPWVVVVGVGGAIPGLPIGTRFELDDSLASLQVHRTGRSARVDTRDLARVPEPLREAAHRGGLVATVASPVTVDGRPWGTITISATTPFPLGTEQRLERFSDIIATAIGNAESKAELAASRRRIVAASDEARRRIERDLHDGTQQRLVALGLAVRSVEADMPEERDDLRSELSRVAAGLGDAVTELQEMSRGIHPANLSKGGLASGLRALARRSAIPIQLDIATEVRPSEAIEVAAYYVASEAIANTTKHAHASQIDLSLAARDGGLLLCIRDDGVGGADPRRGSGLVGLMDRVEAVGGSIRVESPLGAGTRITAALPLDLEYSS